MVAIAPFRALRYNLERIGDLSAVVAPPYDVISPDEQARLYDASPYNVVRLIYGKDLPEDDASDNRYTRAKQAFDAWRAEGMLLRDAAPALYLYQHEFVWQGEPFQRLGFVGLLEFEGSVPGHVFPHEATFGAPKADRTRLLDAVGANLSPIFCVLDDPSHRIHSRLQRLSQTLSPLATARLGEEAVSIWAVTEPQAIQDIRRDASAGDVLIADGHHRFEVALSRRQRFGAVMSYFSCVEDPGLRVRPIHRVARLPAGSQEAWRARCATLCEMTPVESLSSLTRWLSGRQAQGQFGYYEDGRFFQVTIRPQVLAEWLVRPSVPLALAGLDVTLLHQVLVPALLEGRRPADNHLFGYTPDPAQAVAMVERGEGDCAWLLRELPLPQVFALALQGLTLPQKSTYFYPKLLSGLFLNPCEP